MARLPVVGGDDGNWGSILNSFLDVAHNSDGSLITSAVQHAGGVTSVNGKNPVNGVVTLAASDVGAPTTLGGVSDVTIASPGNNQVLAYNSSSSKWVNQAALGSPVAFTFGSNGAVPSSGTYTAGTVAADQNGIARVCLTAGSPGTWMRVGSEPCDFHVDDFGAKGDGKVGMGGTGSSGSSAFSDASASFVSGDSGKVIVVNQGPTGGNTHPFSGTISYSSATSVTLSGNLSAAAAGAPYAYGTDDTAAINSCVLAAYNWGIANNRKVRVIFSDRMYMLGSFTQSTSYSWPSGLTGNYNCHIPLPIPPETGMKFQLELVGTGFAPSNQFWDSLTPQLAGGTVLMSTGTTNLAQPDGTYGQAFIIAAPKNGGSSGISPWVNAMLVMDGITLCAPYNNPIGGLDCLYYGQLAIPTGRVTAFAPINFNNTNTTGGPNLYNSPKVLNDTSPGIQFPLFLNNAFSFVGWLSVEGFGVGVSVAEHFSAQFMFFNYCDRAFQINTPGANPATHGITVLHLGVEESNHAIYVFQGASGGFGNGTCPINIGMLDMENIFVDHINDANNNLVGIVYWNNLTATHPVTSGAQNLIVINTTRVQPGPWSGAPAAPASGTAIQNTSYRYANITISATTITAVTKGQANTGMTTITGKSQVSGGPGVDLRVPPGHWWSATYTGTLTAVWDLD